MKPSKAKELFEAWALVNGITGKEKEMAWEAFKKGVKVAEIYKDER